MANNSFHGRQEHDIVGEFSRSCLGKLVIFLFIAGIILFVAFLLKPSEQTMQEEMTDNIRESIEARDSLVQDDLDVFVTNILHTFTHAEDSVDAELMDNFNSYNTIVYYDRTFFRTAHLYNTFRPEGIRCGIGLFSMVIPLVDFNEFLFREQPKTDYDQPLIDSAGQNDYLGENPALEPFLYNGE